MSIKDQLCSIWNRNNPIRRFKAAPADIIIFIYVLIRTAFLFPDQWLDISSILDTHEALSPSIYIQLAPPSLAALVSRSLSSNLSLVDLSFVKNIFSLTSIVTPLTVNDIVYAVVDPSLIATIAPLWERFNFDCSLREFVLNICNSVPGESNTWRSIRNNVVDLPEEVSEAVDLALTQAVALNNINDIQQNSSDSASESEDDDVFAFNEPDVQAPFNNINFRSGRNRQSNIIQHEQPVQAVPAVDDELKKLNMMTAKAVFQLTEVMSRQASVKTDNTNQLNYWKNLSNTHHVEAHPVFIFKDIQRRTDDASSQGLLVEWVSLMTKEIFSFVAQVRTDDLSSQGLLVE